MRLGATDMGQMIKAAQILESKGLAMLSVGPWSALSAMISNDGVFFVENGGETGIIKEYRNSPHEIIEMVSREVQAATESASRLPQEGAAERTPGPSSDETMNEILSRLGFALANDPAITSSAREDGMRDLESLKIQLSRSTKNWRLIETLLDALAEIPCLLPGLKDLAAVLKNLE
jgi:hypothetical protein